MTGVVILGCGDIGQRVAALWRHHNVEVCALVRHEASESALRARGITPWRGDLDVPTTLAGLPTADCWVYYFAPPPATGETDPRLRAWLQSMSAQDMPKRVIYISTTGVYGDCGGAWVTEDTPPQPRSSRGRRRLDAEQALRAWSVTSKVDVVILRVPGIYGPGRWPLERLRAAIPVVHPEEAPWSNRIHADDLAQVCVRVAEHAPAGALYNVCDGQPSPMTEYFYAVADHFGLPRPPAISFEEARRVLNPMSLSFLEESRRLDNSRMLRELGMTLTYPNLAAGLAAA